MRETVIPPITGAAKLENPTAVKYNPSPYSTLSMLNISIVDAGLREKYAAVGE